MNERKANHLKNIIIIITGVIVSLAGILYIIKQYSKLLSSVLTSSDEAHSNVCKKKIDNRFKQVANDEDVIEEISEEDDISAEIDG